MSIHVVDNKKLDMTDSEWNMYQKIVDSYTTPTNKGEDLFMDLFESDDNGIIIFLKPPSKFRSSMEVFLFLMSLMQHQHLRIMYHQIADLATQVKSKLGERDKK